MAVTLVMMGSLAASRVAFAGGGGCFEPVTDGRGTNVDLKGSCMITTILRIDAGETVTFTNRDAVDHTVTGAGIRSGDGTSFGSFEPIAQRKSFSHTFERDGTYLYYCVFHPGMVGAIVVGDGSGPGAASGNGAAPLGVTRRTEADVASASSQRSNTSSSVPRNIALTVIISGAALVVLVATFVAFARRRIPSVKHAQL